MGRIRTASSIIIAFSIFAIGCNGAGLIMSYLIDLVIPYYNFICSKMVVIGILFLIGGYNLRKMKPWSRVYMIRLSYLLLIGSVLYVIWVWLFMDIGEDGVFLKLGSIPMILLYAVLFLPLISFLKSKSTKEALNP